MMRHVVQEQTQQPTRRSPKFDKKVAETYDEFGIQSAIKLLNVCGIEAVTHADNKFGVDLACIVNGERVFDYDPEVRPDWLPSQEEFKYNLVHIVNRKGDIKRIRPTCYATLRSDGQRFLVLFHHDLKPENKEWRWNKRLGKKEEFYGYLQTDNDHFSFSMNDIAACKKEMERLVDYAVSHKNTYF